MKTTNYFQSHGDHNNSVVPDKKQFAEILSTIGNWYPVAVAEHAIADHPEIKMFALQQTDQPLSFLSLIASKPESNEVYSFYPLAQGKEYEVKITKVFEWEGGYEAYVWATIGEFEFCFLATDYFLNKEQYVEGASLPIELAAIGENIQKGHEDMKMSVEETIKFLTQIGQEPDRDENGDIKPITMGMERLVALFPTFDDLPHFYEFHSPINECQAIKGCGEIDITKLKICISNAEEDVEVPLYFRTDKCPTINKKRNLMGVLWLQAHIKNAFQPIKAAGE